MESIISCMPTPLASVGAVAVASADCVDGASGWPSTAPGWPTSLASLVAAAAVVASAPTRDALLLVFASDCARAELAARLALALAVALEAGAPPARSPVSWPE
jgi:hypothetical protein